MTAQTAARNTARFGDGVLASYLPAGGVAAAKKIWAGALVCVDASGYFTPGATGLGLRAVGISEETVDNSSGSAGDVTAKKVRRGPFAFVNSAGTDALSNADIGRICYIVDDQTVARTDGAGTRSAAGRLVGFEGTAPIVEVGVTNDPMSMFDLFFIAGASLTAKQYHFVKQDSTAGQCVSASAAGEQCLGILQNAPASGAVAIVRPFGRSRCIAGGAVTVGDPVATKSDGRAKTAVKGATKTDDAGVASDALLGSYCMAIAESTTTSDGDTMVVMLTHAGAVPTTVS